ncbi:MAG: rhomboid family intramembrane serine protease, partial [Acidimicrobiia bacterium]|nr:rhomboid family intramembrane serine protease [Acidimicrobiia bacterium]
MIPLRDVNPTGIAPVLTLALIAINAFVFFAVQPQEATEVDRFAYEYAAIACELTTGVPLDATEVKTETCADGPTSADEVFPDKNVYLAVITSMFLHGGLLHVLGNMWFLW